MFLLALIGVPVLEVFALIEVARAIGWLAALVLLLATSVLGMRLVRVQGRATVARVSLAVSEHRQPAQTALDGALGFLGSVLLAVPGFVTDAFGVLLLLPPTRALTRRWISRRYISSVMRFAAASRRFAPGARGPRPPSPPADVESTAVEIDREELGR
jgi:UPF0716 protein FxsA